MSIAVLFVSGCNDRNVNLATGMKMTQAVSEMRQRGLKPEQLSYSKSHNAFELGDGRTIVLIGKQNVDEIQIITNPTAVPANQKMKSVTSFQF